MSLRRTTAAGFAALALVSLAACGKSHNASGDHSSSTTSASVSASSGSSGSSSSALAQKLQKVFTDGKSAHVTMDMGSTGKGEGDIDFAGSKPAIDITISGGQAGSAELRLVDGTMYVKSSLAGDKWLKMDGASAGATGFDPSTFFDQLKNMKGGTDLGNGHWKVDEGSGISADIYFDSDGMLQKSVVNGAGSSAITVTYSDWGKKVEVKAPPANQVMELPDMSSPNIPSMSASQ